MLKTNQLRSFIQNAYSMLAEPETSSRSTVHCCDCSSENLAQTAGYTKNELSQIPKSANLGLSCGNPLSLVDVRQGDVVLDLGSGAGMDCFLAASYVGKDGSVIGVDFAPAMVTKATQIATKKKIDNVTFTPGEIEQLPIPDASIDLVISNCVINLSNQKQKVFDEVYRVLKPEGRIAISDMALRKSLPEEIRNSPEAHSACIGGAITINAYRSILEQSGFHNIETHIKGEQACISDMTTDPIGQIIFQTTGNKIDFMDYVASISIKADKN